MSVRLKRKIETVLAEYYQRDPGKILLVDGARQTGKSYIIRETARSHFANYLEINLFEDRLGMQRFANVDTVDKFELALSLVSNLSQEAKKDNTIVFLDEIQEYPALLPLLKFINEKGRYRYIASGSALGLELSRSSSIPMGSVFVVTLHPLDFEEFLWAKGINQTVIDYLRTCFNEEKSIEASVHEAMMLYLRRYLVTGGLPEVVRHHVENEDTSSLRALQSEIRGFYAADCSKYDSIHRLKIMRIYNLLPSFMEQKKKRVVYKAIDPKSARADKYADEFDFLIASGVALGVQAVTNPVFPLGMSITKNLIKLYLNDVGLLSSVLFGPNLDAILDDSASINLGALYETLVAMELSSHGHQLFYYDNRAKGEVDFLINDYNKLSILPIEVKSGRDYQIHSSLTNMLKGEAGQAQEGLVLSNSAEVKRRGKILYLPIYQVMFL